MDNPEVTTADNQPAEEEPVVDGMAELQKAIQAQFSQDPAEEPTETQETLPVDQTEAEMQPAEETEPTETAHESGFQKRIDKLTWQKKELQEELENTRSQLAELKNSPQPNQQPSNISEVVNLAETPEKLDQLEEESFQAERWAKVTLNRYRRDPDSVETEIKNKIGSVPEDVETWLEDLSLNSEYSRTRDIPARRKAIEQQRRDFEFATTKYPWLSDPRNPLRAWVDQQKQTNPALKSIPQIDLHLARSLIGLHVENARANQDKPRAKTPDPTSQPRKPQVTGADIPESIASLEKAKTEVMKDGSVSSLAKYIQLAATAKK